MASYKGFAPQHDLTAPVYSSLAHRREVLSRLFAHEIVRPSSPVCGFLCVRQDYTHPLYPDVRWLPGSEHPGHFVLSTQPLGSLSWLDPADRLTVRVVECALVPESIIGGGHDTIEAESVVVSAERTKPMGPHTEALQSFWAGIVPDNRELSRQRAIELASEALLRFRLFGRFRCRGVSFVKSAGGRTGWSPDATETGGAWAKCLATTQSELRRLRLGVLHETEWAFFADGVEQLVRDRVQMLPRLALLNEHVLYTSYAIASGPASARLNPFAPLVSLALMGIPALGMVGDWFWLSAGDRLAPGRHVLRGSFFDHVQLPIASCGR